MKKTVPELETAYAYVWALTLWVCGDEYPWEASPHSRSAYGSRVWRSESLDFKSVVEHKSKSERAVAGTVDVAEKPK